MAKGQAGNGGRNLGSRCRVSAQNALRLLLHPRTVPVVVGLSLVLGFIGLREYLSSGTPRTSYGDSIANVVYYDLQLPFLTSAPNQAAGHVTLLLDIARFLAPAGIFLAALAAVRLVLTDQILAWRVARARGHVVVAGDGQEALTLARNLGADGNRVILVSASDATLAKAAAGGILAVKGDPSGERVLTSAGITEARELYACTAQGAANAAIVLRARKAVAEDRGARRLSAYALVRDAELGVALRARRIGAKTDPNLRLDFFSVEEIAARRLFDDYPLLAADGRPVQVMIVGFGPLGQAVLRGAALSQPYVRDGSPVSVFLRHATQPQVDEATRAFPVIGARCSIHLDGAPDPGAGEYRVFVCLSDQDDALRQGLVIAHQLATGNGNVVVCMTESEPFAEVLGGELGLLDNVMGRISIFGVLNAACQPSAIRDDTLEQMARANHVNYLQSAREGVWAATPDALVPWSELSADLRQTNIDQAISVGSMLDKIGTVVTPVSANAPQFSYTDKEVEDLARQEHERWREERETQGWRYAPGEKDPVRKTHPDLVDWEKLPEPEREKNRAAIRAFPAILAEAGLQILRLQPERPAVADFPVPARLPENIPERHPGTRTVSQEPHMPANLSDDDLERIAAAIHERYVAHRVALGDPAGGSRVLVPWADLDEDFKHSNRDQAAEIPGKLASIGASIAPGPGDGDFAFTDEEIEALSRNEHDRWLSERQSRGWTYGPRDDKDKLHPDLVPYEDLTEPARDKDRQAILGIPHVLRAAGLHIRRDR